MQAAETGQPWWPGLSVYIWILPFLAPMAPKLFRSVATTISVLTTMVPFGVTAVTGCITAAIGPGTPVLPAICPRDNLFFNEWGFHHRRPQVQAFERTTRSTAIGLPVFSSGPSTQLVWSQCSTNRNTIFVTKTGLPILLGW